MNISAIQCPDCKQIIYSRARHDYRSCRCRSVAIDGGFDYLRIINHASKTSPKIIRIKVKATKKQLYEDWNSTTNQYGRVEEDDCIIIPKK